jgi:ribonuclease R
MSQSLTHDRVLQALKAAAGRPLKAKDLSRQIGADVDDRGEIRAILRDLVDQGHAIQLEGRRFVHSASPIKGAGVPGVVQRKASGVGWFVPDSKQHKDGFLPPEALRSVVDGDRVLARLEKGHRGPVAVIVEVLSHGRLTVTGTLRSDRDRRGGRVAYVEVDDNVLSGYVRVKDGGEAAKDGDVVEVKLTTYPTALMPAEGVIVRRIGQKGALDVEIERLIVAAGVVKEFPAPVVVQAESYGNNPADDEFAGRTDLRHLPIVTIDGETAKDFDDAVYAAPSKKKKGSFDVIVCVADVSHYVTEGSPLDVEARRRATSIYYPGRVIPMLPEALSNGLCSLKPRVPRLCAVAEFVVDENGAVSGERFSFGVMQSRARLTYSLVQRFLDEEEGKPEAERYAVPPQPKEATQRTGDLDNETQASLRCLAEAARRLRAARSRRGALDFELPEVVIDLDARKEPLGLRHLDRAFSHRLIEDLMIAANEAAARYFDDNDRPSIYRIHELPDDEKLERFLNLARPALLATGQKLPKGLLEDGVTSTALMELLKALGASPIRAALDMLLLRSMKQARYSVDNVGHYGLGSDAYLHFTSPIRRYPDLVVHRRMRQTLSPTSSKKKKKQSDGGDDVADALFADLEDIAASSSEQERKASDLERSISQLYACWLMRDKIGEVHPAVVTGVSEAGAFVRLEDLFVEGLVRMQDLGSEYFAYDEERLTLRGERSRDVITFGTRFDVEVLGVDLQRRQVGFLRASDIVAAHDGDNVDDNDRAKRSDGGQKGAWSPRTDARPSAPRGGRGSGHPRDRDDGRSGARGPARASDKRERRRERVREHVESVDEKKKAAAAPLPDPRGRGRGEKQRQLAFETAKARVEDGTATAEERIYFEERRAMLSARTADRAAVKRERKQKAKEQQERYEKQQQLKPSGSTSSPKPAAPPPQEKPRLRGPEDLRALFESRAPSSKTSTPRKGKKKTAKAPAKKR